MSRPEPPCECEEPFDFGAYFVDFIERNTRQRRACEGGSEEDDAEWDSLPSVKPDATDLEFLRKRAKEQATVSALLDYVRAVAHTDPCSLLGWEAPVDPNKCKDRVTISSGKADQVEHPSHYASGAIECFDAMQAMATTGELIAFCRLAAFKYIWRAGKKGPAGVDYRKAIWYLAKAAELEEAKK